MFALATRQKRIGHTVAIFGGVGGGDRPSGFEYFDYGIKEFHSQTTKLEKVASFSEVIWSQKAKAALQSAVEDFLPDVIHLHNYSHQLSSSVLAKSITSSAKIVHTAHDYKLICPAYVANVDGKDCFSCAKAISLKLIQEKCHHSDLAWSVAVAVESQFVRAKRLAPASIIAPSEYMYQKLRQSWLPPSSISMIRNAAEPTKYQWTDGGDALLYIGRLSREKGVDKLIDSASDLGIELWIAGDGPLRNQLEQQAKGLNVKFFGHLNQDELGNLRQHCMAQVLPSEWPENAPLSAIEALVDGVPLLVSNRGGMPEYLKLGGKVALFEEMNPENLENSLVALNKIPGSLQQIRAELSWGRHLDEVTKIYES
jgi:glycosyltransferase involved in cell wall biosynthesis